MVWPNNLFFEDSALDKRVPHCYRSVDEEGNLKRSVCADESTELDKRVPHCYRSVDEEGNLKRSVCADDGNYSLLLVDGRY